MMAQHLQRLDGESGTVTLSAYDWPMLLATLEGHIDEELTIRWNRAYLQTVLERKERFVYVLDASGRGEFPARSRRVIADFVKEHESPKDPLRQLHVGSLYVLPSPLTRGIATAIFWMQVPKFRWQFTASLPEAFEVAAGWFRAEGVNWKPRSDHEAPLSVTRLTRSIRRAD